MNSNYFLIIFIFCFLMLPTKLLSQSGCPPNLDFESGNFSNWECFIGKTSVNGSPSKNIITLTSSSPATSRHEIISKNTAQTKDPFGEFPTLCPYGGNYSVKLGNQSSGSEAEGVSYTFTIPATLDTFTFTYFYAVVFEDPGHSAPEQPRFFATAYDVATGELVNCASYNYIATGSIPGFEKSKKSPGVLFKNWTPTSLQFAGLAGRTVRLEFKTADCTLGGHFGYAYLDVASGCTNILATAPYCIETNSLILNAPYGFASYTWYNEDFSKIIGNTQSLTLSPPPTLSGTFKVDAIPYAGYGCRDTFNAIVKPLPVPDTPNAQRDYSFCQNSIPSTLSASSPSGNEIWWYTSATGGIPLDKPPPISTASLGTKNYYVTQKVFFGCESKRKEVSVNILPTPIVSFSTNSNSQCLKENVFNFKSTSLQVNNPLYKWEMGDNSIITTSKDSLIKYSYTKHGTYPVKLSITNEGNCSSQTTMIQKVVPTPIAVFTVPQQIVCQNITPLSVIDNSIVPDGLSVINKWWWNIDNNISLIKNPASRIITTNDSISISLVVSSTEGCGSDTAKTKIPIRTQPKAAFSYGSLLCNNELIQFKNLSTFVSPPNNESITKWFWQFSNTQISPDKDPGTYFNIGNQKASLVVESNYGCKSIQIDSIFNIHPKPLINLQINDSCVFKAIRYNASDNLGIAKNWYWNFDNGLYKGNTEIFKTYSRKNSFPLTLIGQTDFGCKDTISRLFTIYDNTSIAQRDTIAAMDEPVQLIAGGYTDTKYTWTPAIGLSDPSIENPVAILDKEQLYNLYSITKEGCERKSSVTVKRYKGPELYIPTAFTPNRDGRNDVLKVFTVGIKIFYYFSIFDRYGNLVFRTTNPANGWDGTINGKPAQSGTYIHVAEAIDYKNRAIIKKGTTVLLR